MSIREHLVGCHAEALTNTAMGHLNWARGNDSVDAGNEPKLRAIFEKILGVPGPEQDRLIARMADAVGVGTESNPETISAFLVRLGSKSVPPGVVPA